MTLKAHRGLGWKPDLPDIRDRFYSTKGVIKRGPVLPTKIDLSGYCPPVYDQGDLGSCTAQAVTALCSYLYRWKTASVFAEENVSQIADPKTFMQSSALFTYYVTRDIEGNVPVDSGATLRNAIKSVNEFGVCNEKLWPYHPKDFTLRPDETAFIDAEKHQALEYQRIDQNLRDMKCVLVEGIPFVFGFSVYESLYHLSAEDDWIVKYPQEGDRLVGGHAVLAVGYDDNAQAFIIRNSWGTDWGFNGYFYLPYNYVVNPGLAADFWTIRLMETLH